MRATSPPRSVATVAVLETTLTPELLAEGLVRDLTHLVQDVRKHAGLAIEDTIDTWVTTDAESGRDGRAFRQTTSKTRR